jgi:hypothetical protein
MRILQKVKGHNRIDLKNTGKYYLIVLQEDKEVSKINEAVNRIKILECPTGELENSVALILEDYGVADMDRVKIGRDSSLDRDEAQGYRVKIQDEGQSIIVLAKSGYDDYVATVVDAYTNLAQDRD